MLRTAQFPTHFLNNLNLDGQISLEKVRAETQLPPSALLREQEEEKKYKLASFKGARKRTVKSFSNKTELGRRNDNFLLNLVS